MKRHFDLIVVGGGPAGLMAAKTAAEKGLDVALLERKDHLAEIARPCSEILTLNEDINNEYLFYNKKGGRLCFLKSGFCERYDGHSLDLEAFTIYAMNGNCIQFSNPAKPQGGGVVPVQMAFEKKMLLSKLLVAVEKKDVHVFTNVNVVAFEKKGRHMCILSSEGTRYEAAFVICADGVNSRSVQCLGLNKRRGFYGTLRGIALYIRGVELPIAHSHVHIQGGSEVGIELSINPRAENDEYFVSLCGIQPKADFSRWADYIMKTSRFSSWFKGAEIVKTSSFVANIYSPLRDPFRDNVLVIGDAGNTLQVTNKGALVCGWRAGNTVARAFYNNSLNREAMQDYLEWWDESYCRCDYTIPFPLRGNMGEALNSKELNYLFGLLKEPFPLTSNPFTGARTMARAMAKVLPLLAEKKPQIIEKLNRFRSDDLTQLLKGAINSGFPNR